MTLHRMDTNGLPLLSTTVNPGISSTHGAKTAQSSASPLNPSVGPSESPSQSPPQNAAAFQKLLGELLAMEIQNIAGGLQNTMGSSRSSLSFGSEPFGSNSFGDTPATNTSGVGVMNYWLTQLLGTAAGSPQTTTNSSITSINDSLQDTTVVSPSAGTSSQTFTNTIEAASHAFGLPSSLIHSVIQTESGYDPQAVGSTGAVGLMQLMPDTAREMGVNNPHDPVQNIWGGTRYLASLVNQFHGNVELAVAAYNAGPGAVLNHGGVPPYPETTAYVKKVLTGAGLTEV